MSYSANGQEAVQRFLRCPDISCILMVRLVVAHELNGPLSYSVTFVSCSSLYQQSMRFSCQDTHICYASEYTRLSCHGPINKQACPVSSVLEGADACPDSSKAYERPGRAAVCQALDPAPASWTGVVPAVALLSSMQLSCRTSTCPAWTACRHPGRYAA